MKDVEQKINEELEKLDIELKVAGGWNKISKCIRLRGKRQGLLIKLLGGTK